MLDLDQILSKEQKKALKKHFNNPETKAREKRMNALEKKMQKKMQEDAIEWAEDTMIRIRNRKLFKRIIWSMVGVLILIWITG